LENRKIIIVILLIFLTAGIVGYFLLKGEGTDTRKPGGEEKERVVKPKERPSKKTEYSKISEEKIPAILTENNQGLPKEIFKINEKSYLSITQSGSNTYNEEYPADKVVWIMEKDGKVEYKMLTEGSYLVKLAKSKEGPFLKAGNETFVVFHERVNFDDYGYNLKGYVYKVFKNGELKFVYETQGAFDNVAIKKGKLYLGEKIYKDDRNQYPTILKPYDLTTILYEDGKWDVVGTEYVKPQKK